jgi:hypothetical protein
VYVLVCIYVVLYVCIYVCVCVPAVDVVFVGHDDIRHCGVLHLDKAEAPRFAASLIDHQRDVRQLPELLEVHAKVLLRGHPAQTSDEDLTLYVLDVYLTRPVVLLRLRRRPL